MSYKCLIVDDEEMICQSTCEYFNIFDLPTTYVTSYESALDFLEQNSVSILILDINLGSHSGFELCKRIREKTNIPILFISARTSDDDILTALNIGGDDYITKPYSLNILLAKVKAILKRCEANPAQAVNTTDSTSTNTNHKADPAAAQPKGIHPICNSFALDYNYRQALVEGEPVRLKDMEFKLLSYLAEHKNQVITKDELLDEVWESRFISEGTLSVHIRRLRQKIEKNPDEPEYLKTIWGVGYVFEEK
ncbi:MAG: response regulator transcription factor [bacterium]|nr:response regulator transcription factor [bacterium]